MAPKWSILVSQCEMDHQKPTILLNFGTLSLGGCWGHPMRPKSNLTCIFLSVRAKLKKTLFPRTLCKLKPHFSELKFNCRILRPGWISRERGFARGILILSGWQDYSLIGYLTRKSKEFYPVLARRYNQWFIYFLSLNSVVWPRPLWNSLEYSCRVQL